MPVNEAWGSPPPGLGSSEAPSTSRATAAETIEGLGNSRVERQPDATRRALRACRRDAAGQQPRLRMVSPCRTCAVRACPAGSAAGLGRRSNTRSSTRFGCSNDRFGYLTGYSTVTMTPAPTRHRRFVPVAAAAATTDTTVLRNTVACFAARGVVTERVLSDNGSPDRVAPVTSRATSSASNSPAPGRGDHRPTATSNAFTAPWPTDGAAPAATHQKANAAPPPALLHEYNHHRPHSACGYKPPTTCLTNLLGQHSWFPVRAAAIIRCPWASNFESLTW